MSLLATIGGFLGSQGFSSAMNTLGGITSGIAGIIQSKKNRKAAKEIAQMQYDSTIEGINLQNEANRQLAEYQNEWNLAQWNRENEYNSPEQQLARLKAAGLNPNLAYNMATTGNANESPQAAGYQADYSKWQTAPKAVPANIVNLGETLKALSGIYKTAQELKSMDLDNQARESGIEKTKVETSLIGAKADYFDSMMSRWMRDSDQQFYLRGGSITEETAKNIQKATDERFRFASKFPSIDYTHALLLNDLLSGRKTAYSIANELAGMQRDDYAKEHKFNQAIGQSKYWISFIIDNLSKAIGGFGIGSLMRGGLKKAMSGYQDDYFDDAGTYRGSRQRTFSY